MRLTSLLIFIAIGAYAPMAHGVKLYKWIDPDGNVTYQDRPPPASSVYIEEKNIDPDQTVTKFVLPKKVESGQGSGPVSVSRSARSGGPSTATRGGLATLGDQADTPGAGASTPGLGINLPGVDVTGVVPTPSPPSPPTPPAPPLPSVPPPPAPPLAPLSVPGGAGGGF